MKLEEHILYSTIFAVIVFLAVKNIILIITFLISAILIDLDHLLDYFIFHPMDFIHPIQFLRKRIKYFLSCKWYKKKVFVFLHSFELVGSTLALAILLNNKILLFTTLGFSFHLLLDILGNVLKKRSIKKLRFYFLTYRASKKFLVNKLLNVRNI